MPIPSSNCQAGESYNNGTRPEGVDILKFRPVTLMIAQQLFLFLLYSIIPVLSIFESSFFRLSLSLSWPSLSSFFPSIFLIFHHPFYKQHSFVCDRAMSLIAHVFVHHEFRWSLSLSHSANKFELGFQF